MIARIFNSAVFMLHVALVAVILVCASSALAATALTSNTADDLNSDVAIDGSGNVHLVYERGGSVYYNVRSAGVWGTEETVATGTGPTVAVDGSGLPHVCYIDGGTATYINRSGGSWGTATALNRSDGPVSTGVETVDIDVESDGTAHVVWRGTGGGAYPSQKDIFYSTNSSGSFVTTWIQDGYSDPGNTRNYYFPRVKADSSGFFHIVYLRHWISGSYRIRDVYYVTNTSGSPVTTESPTDLAETLTMGRNSLSLAPGGDVHTAYYAGTTGYDGKLSSGTWTEPIYTGTEGTVLVDGSGNVHVAYVDGTNGIAYKVDTGTGFSAPVILAPTSTGGNPALFMNGSVANMTFEAHDGVDREVYLAEAVPAVSVTPVSNNFGDVLAGTSSMPQEFVVANAGVGDLVVSGISIAGTDSGQFALALAGANPCASTAPTLGTGTSCTVTVTFNPASLGAKSASLSVSSNDSDNATLLTSLGGNGTAYTLTISKAGTGTGTVTSDATGWQGDGIDCGADCSESYTPASVVNLTATPDADSSFSGWSDAADCSDESVTMNADVNCTATFTLKQYTVTPAAGAGGSINPSTPQPVTHGSTTAFTLTPAANYHIDTVSGCGGSLAGSTYTTGAITAECTVTAAFALDTFTLTVSKAGIGPGTVSTSPAGVNCGSDCSEVYTYGTVVTMTADPHPRGLWAGFSGDADCSDGTVTMTADRNCTAGFSALGDWNVDGTPDLAFRNPDGKNALLYLVGSAKVGVNFLVPAPTNLAFAGAADMDDDGLMDLLFRDPVTGALICAYFDRKDYRSYKILPFKAPPWELAGTGDHDNDEQADLFWTNPVTGENEVVYMVGGASTGSDSLPKAPPPWKVVAIDDMNGDGVLDLIARSTDTGMFAAGYLNGTNLAGKGAMPAAPLSQDFIGTMDVNGDGKPDIVLRDPSTGMNEAWYMDGTKRKGDPVKLPTAPPPWEGMTGYK